VILGIGSDLTDIRRIEKMLVRFGDRFERRIFTDSEIAKANSRAGERLRAATLAKRFAAKEACIKALGSGLSGIRWHEMEVANLPSGQPTLQLSGQSTLCLQRLTPRGHASQVNLSMTDEYPYAQAFVVISAYPLR
jgi:holo-[acyl-carrier protein] synthase